MSRDLAFWKYDEGKYLDNKAVYEQTCIEGVETAGLSALPISGILAKVSEVFGDYEKLDEYNYESQSGGFTITATAQSVLFSCSFSMPETDLNKIIEIMAGYACPLYDPQIDVRFDGR